MQVNGDVIYLEVTPEMTGRELKQQVKEGKLWDKATCRLGWKFLLETGCCLMMRRW